VSVALKKAFAPGLDATRLRLPDPLRRISWVGDKKPRDYKFNATKRRRETK
jgi:hypothetical protein